MPSPHKSSRRKSKITAICGLLSALSLVILLMGSIIPAALFACPVLAMVMSIPAVEQFGTKTAFCLYAVTAILALLLAADKELAMFYLFVGYYPAIRQKLDRFPRWARIVIKLLIFNTAIAVMYALIIFVFRLSAVIAEFHTTGRTLIALTVLLGNITFLLFDICLKRLTYVYNTKFAGKI